MKKNVIILTDDDSNSKNMDLALYTPINDLDIEAPEEVQKELNGREVHENVPDLIEVVKRVPLRDDAYDRAQELQEKLVDLVKEFYNVPDLFYRMGYMDGATDAIHNVENGTVYIDEDLRRYNLELREKERNS